MSSGTANVAYWTALLARKSSNIAKSSTTSTETETETDEHRMLPRTFNQIILEHNNNLLPEEKLKQSPSFVDGMDAKTEKDLRIFGCHQIQTAGILLKLPQVAIATGQVLFQRFYYMKSFVRFNMEILAMSCIYLASKVEEEPRQIRDVMNVFQHMKQIRTQKDIAPLILDQSYSYMKNQIIKEERRLLKVLGFCVYVKHPYTLMVMYLQVLNLEQNHRLLQMTWNFINDSFRTDVFLRYTPENIACACIYLSSRKLGIPLPRNPSWFGLFSVKEDDIIDISYRIMDVYMRPKPNFPKLEATLNELKQRYIESKNKTKEQKTQQAETTDTTTDQKSSSYIAFGGFTQRMVPSSLSKEEKPPLQKSRSRSRSPISSSKERSHQNSYSASSSSHTKTYKRKSSRDCERSFYISREYSSNSSNYNSNSDKYDEYDNNRNYRYDKYFYCESSTSKKCRHMSDRMSKENFRSRSRSPILRSKKILRQYSFSPSNSPRRKYPKYEEYDSKPSGKRSHKTSGYPDIYERFDKYDVNRNHCNNKYRG